MKLIQAASTFITPIAVMTGITAFPIELDAQILQEKQKDVNYTEWIRDARARDVRRIAILPPIVLLRFEVNGRVPDVQRFAVRRVVANEMPPLVKELVERDGKSAVVEQAGRALAESGLRPVDLVRYATGTEEELNDKHGSKCRLAMARSDLKGSALSLTVFQYVPAERKSLTSGICGLAAVAKDIRPQWNTEKLKLVAGRLTADGLLFIRIEDMDVVGTHFEQSKSVWITVHATLISSVDASPLLDAAFRTNAYTREESDPTKRKDLLWEKTEHQLALECLAKITPVLVKRFFAAE